MPEIIRVQITVADRRVLTAWSMEVRAVVWYEWARGTSVSTIRECLTIVYGEEVMSQALHRRAPSFTRVVSSN